MLGPAYFDAQRVAAKVMEKFEAEHFKPVIDKLSQEVTDRLWMISNPPCYTIPR